MAVGSHCLLLNSGATIVLAVVNFGMGNLRSVMNAFSHLGAEPVEVDSPNMLAKADKIILPGVGSFNRAMHNIREAGFDVALERCVMGRNIPLLGICVGMQILGTEGTEDQPCMGLGFINGTVEKFSFDTSKHPDLKIPHVGFNTVSSSGDCVLFDGLESHLDFYFTHSYRMIAGDINEVVGSCWHGEEFAAMVQKGPVCGTQFHPEKSQTNGLTLLQNFLEKF